MNYRWVEKDLVGGTLHTEGFFLTQKEGSQWEKSGISTDFINYSDSATEQRLDWLRFLETSAQYIHFTSIHGAETGIRSKTRIDRAATPHWVWCRYRKNK